VGCGFELVFSETLDSLRSLGRSKPPPSPRLHDGGNLIEVFDVENCIHAIVPILHEADAWNVGEAVGDWATVISTCTEKIASMGINMAELAGNCLNPGVATPAITVALRLAALLVTNSISFSEPLF
jgi:hypothetical protein